jgi:RecB family endonuclease NucS
MPKGPDGDTLHRDFSVATSVQIRVFENRIEVENLTMPEKQDPLGEFDITDYDPEAEFVTIQIHRSILANPRHVEALARKCEEIITHGPSVAGVKVVPRK